MDFDKHLASIDGVPVHFTPIEYKIISLLCKHAGKVLTHDYIMREVWGLYCDENQALRVNIANIRRKIEKNPAEPEFILTKIGFGYRFSDKN